MSGHGPDGETFEKASRSDTSKPHKVADTMAFMFETRTPIAATEYALNSPQLQANYQDCWAGIGKHFDPDRA
jgi:homogentisate 1,2-dioxygenase